MNAIIPLAVGYEGTGYNKAEYKEQYEQQVMEGTITLYSSRVTTLFDISATHSFIIVKIIQK